MDYEGRLRISYYETIKSINAGHGIFLVKHSENGGIFVRKNLTVYNRNVYEYLLHNPVAGLPKLIDLYEENGTLAVIEEYISGTDLSKIIDSGHSFSREEIINISTRVLNVLKRLHALKMPVIHRDVKPSNVILTSDGEVFLIDLNAGRFYDKAEGRNADTSLLGTHGYAAPEQYGFGESTPLTDIFGAGMLLKELLSHSDGKKNVDDIKKIADKMSKLKPEDRYENIDEIIANLHTTRVGSFIRKYAPPGFRQGNILHMLIAVPVYLLMGFIALGLNVNGGGYGITVAYRIIFGLMELSTVLCTFNYVDIQRFFPLCKSKNKLTKTLGLILMNGSMYAFLVVILVIAAQFLT